MKRVQFIRHIGKRMVFLAEEVVRKGRHVKLLNAHEEGKEELYPEYGFVLGFDDLVMVEDVKVEKVKS